MSQQSQGRAPLGVYYMIVVISLIAVTYLVVGLWLAFGAPLSPTFATDNRLPLPSWTPLVNGLMSLLLGLLYLALVRLIATRSSISYIMVQAIAFVSIVFNVARLPVGLIAIAIAISIVIASNADESKAWLQHK